jgi:hypothetical protein
MARDPMTVPPTSDDYFVSTVVQPVFDRPPGAHRATPRRRSNGVVASVVIGVLLVGAAAAYVLTRGSAPRAPGSDMVEAVHDAVTVQAEVNRRAALQAVVQVAAEQGTVDAPAVAQAEPQLTWVAGTQPSTGPRVVSLAAAGPAATIAVASTSGRACAFGRWTGTAMQVVTVDGEGPCRAADAPAAGWSAGT